MASAIAEINPQRRPSGGSRILLRWGRSVVYNIDCTSAFIYDGIINIHYAIYESRTVNMHHSLKVLCRSREIFLTREAKQGIHHLQ